MVYGIIYIILIPQLSWSLSAQLKAGDSFSCPETKKSSKAHQKEAVVSDVQLSGGETAPPAANSSQ